MTFVINGTTGATQSASFDSASTFGFKNRIINGAMMIDQRNAGASVTASATSATTYTLDRWAYYVTAASKFTVQQSSVAPAGFINSMLVTSSSAYSVAAGDLLVMRQAIEGLNVADLGWGAAGAATVTLSFWVRSSLTGTFGGSLTNSAGNRAYPFSFTINAANTWEQKSITIAGDTTGTWLTTNGQGIMVYFSMGSGSNYQGTANTWAGATYTAPTGATSVVGTNGATFYITGVQLEKGSTATSFDFRSYGTELALCQRYLPAWNRVGNDVICMGQSTSATSGVFTLPFCVTPRIPPTGVTTSTASGFYAITPSAGAAATVSSISFNTASPTSGSMVVGYSNNGGAAGQANHLLSNTSGAQILFTGCEL